MAAEPDQTLLIQFAKAPLAGRVKTRMIPHLTPAQACELHRELVLWTTQELVESRLGPVELAVAGDAADPLFGRCQALGISGLTLQSGQDLGRNMHHAIEAGLARYPAVVLVGSDCPWLDKAYLSEALAALKRAPVVLGPAADGGYVLIGARRICAQLFEGIRWGTSSVYADTTGRLSELGWGWAELPTLADIDRPADLPLWQELRKRRD